MANQDWQDILDQINVDHPELSDLNWSTLMGYDTDVLAQLLGDILKVEGKSSRPGKRPNLDRDIAEAQLVKISADDYSEYDFQRSFAALMYGKSIRQVANKCNIDKMVIMRYKNGTSTPSLEAMEKIALAFKKNPSYFLEYRIASVLNTINQFLMDSPETATAWFLKTRNKRG